MNRHQKMCLVIWLAVTSVIIIACTVFGTTTFLRYRVNIQENSNSTFSNHLDIFQLAEKPSTSITTVAAVVSINRKPMRWAYVFADDELREVYIDGVRIKVGKNSGLGHLAYSLTMPVDYDSIAIMSTNLRHFGGLQFEYMNHNITSSGDWKCSSRFEENWHTTEFDDEKWEDATVLQTDKYSIKPITDDAAWIWHNIPLYRKCKFMILDCTFHGPADAFCRFNRKPRA